MIREGVIIGRCVTDFAKDGRCELYIDLLEEFQKQGLGTIMTSAMVERLSQRGLAIYWLTWYDNMGSIKTAEKVGFRLEKSTNVYEIKYDGLVD